MFKRYYEDFAVGDESRFGSYEVTREEVIAFASAYDPQPFHLDDEIAKQSVFGALCASGWHTCAMTMRMIVDNLMAEGVAGMGSPGVDQIRWKKPVFPGDILSVTSTVLEARPSASRPNLGLVKMEQRISNQAGETVMTLVSNVMLLRRESD